MGERMTVRRGRRFAGPLLAVVAYLGLAVPSWMIGARYQPPRSETAQARFALGTAEYGRLVETWDLSGTLAMANIMRVSAGGPGAAVRVRGGQHVASGDVLFIGNDG